VSGEKSATDSSGRARIVFLDGLRGIASMSVVVLHLLADPLSHVAPALAAVAHRGFLGVYVFFVVSGFAVSHALSGSRIDLAAAGRFILRRVLRLDPPYWASMVVVTLVVYAANRFLHRPEVPIGGWRVWLANIFYVQYILGVPSLCDVYWTLAFEIQFYLLLVVLVASKQRLEERLGETTAFVVTFALPLAYSILVLRGAPTFRGSCMVAWRPFFAGVLAQRFVTRNDLRTYLVGLALIVVSTSASEVLTDIISSPFEITATAVGTAGLLGLGHVRGRLDAWLSGRVVQHLGRISYSLYLTHWIIAGRLVNLLNRGLHASGWVAVLTGLVGVAVAVAFAHAFWWAIERPSLTLSRRLGRRAVHLAPSPQAA
jgi:peptidoglycan/LPS O-acetylase OafA/YrhL